MFNSAFPSFSLYNLNKTDTSIPSGTLDLFLQIEINSSTTIIDSITTTNSTLTNSALNETADLQTTVVSNTFSVNSTQDYNTVAVSDIPCLMKGTKILMSDYTYRLIEELVVGDKLLTHDNRITIVQKISSYTVAGINEICPFIIPIGQHNAFEDLYLSGGHAILIDDYFVAANDKLLDLNNDLNFNKVQYYNIEVSDFYNDTIVANGVAVEAWDGIEKTVDNVNRKFEKEYVNSQGYRYLKNNK
jgi:hypothetical protein